MNAFSEMFNNILLTGASGQLGRRIASSGLFKRLLTPGRTELDLCRSASIKKYFRTHAVDAIIHTAAIARMHEAERNPARAMQTNIMGTCRLAEQALRTNARFIHISTDGVYPSTAGKYKENSAAIPYNRYGWTKLGAECAVNLLNNFCIIRTRFFDPADIPFDTHAVDAYSSAIPVDELVKAIHALTFSSFTGTVNVGGPRRSDHARYKKFKPQSRPCRLADIQKDVGFTMSRDASMDCRLWKKIRSL